VRRVDHTAKTVSTYAVGVLIIHSHRICDPETSRLQTAFRWCKFKGLGLLPGPHNFSLPGCPNVQQHANNYIDKAKLL